MKPNPEGIEKVARIISHRDGESLDNSLEVVTECVEEMIAAIESGEGDETVYDIIMDDLGLEPDYIDELILF